MIAVHPIHRRLAELHEDYKRRGGIAQLSPDELDEIAQCLTANANLVIKLDKLDELSLIASYAKDTEWQYEICRQQEEIEAICNVGRRRY